MQSQKKKIFVGMSGGVDSSVTAFLLKEAGHLIEGVFMKNWEADDTDTYCPASQDMDDAQKICDQLHIPLHRINFSAEYWSRVFDYFLREYRAGRTPNPDILCNKEIKFKAFLDYALLHSADFIATGHYARIQIKNGKYYLQKGMDPTKDQSYFLYALNTDQLASSLFPIGHLTKKTVRDIAKKNHFANHAKKDSTGICFIGEKKFTAFLKEYLPTKPGMIQTVDGKIIGKHDGLMFYTLGQRQGLQIGGQKNYPEAPWYVVEKKISENILVIAQGEHPALYSKKILAMDCHWINEEPIFPIKLQAKIRYRQEDQPCLVTQNEHHQIEIIFDEPQRAATPGQSIVFYKEDICLGGGIIDMISS